MSLKMALFLRRQGEIEALASNAAADMKPATIADILAGVARHHKPAAATEESREARYLARTLGASAQYDMAA